MVIVLYNYSLKLFIVILYEKIKNVKGKTLENLKWIPTITHHEVKNGFTMDLISEWNNCLYECVHFSVSLYRCRDLTFDQAK